MGKPTMVKKFNILDNDKYDPVGDNMENSFSFTANLRVGLHFHETLGYMAILGSVHLAFSCRGAGPARAATRCNLYS